MVFCLQKCFDLVSEKKWSSYQEKLLKFKAEGQEFAKCLRSVKQIFQTVEGQNKFW